MRSLPLSLVALALLTAACGKTALDAPAKTADTEALEAKADTDATEEAAPEEELAAPAREPGDYVVFQFTGSYKPGQRTLTQRVVDKTEQEITLDMTLHDGVAQKTLRVTLSETPETFGEVLAVSNVQGGVAKPAELAAYDAMMKEVVLAADQNEAQLDSEDTVVAVGDQSIDCTKTSYRVKVGTKSATLSTLTSAAFPWGDVGGEIASDTGEVIYRAKLVAIGNGDAKEALLAAGSDAGVALRP